jgi:hypothetical protein
MKHNFTIQRTAGMGVVICCKACEDPEDEACNWIWIDWNGDVIYDDTYPATLFKFYIHHDGFGLLKAAGVASASLEENSPYSIARQVVQRLESGAVAEEQVG